MPAKIFQIRTSIDRSKPEIWRRVLVPADISLAKLHHVIQIYMGWEDVQ